MCGEAAEVLLASCFGIDEEIVASEARWIAYVGLHASVFALWAVISIMDPEPEFGLIFWALVGGALGLAGVRFARARRLAESCRRTTGGLVIDGSLIDEREIERMEIICDSPGVLLRVTRHNGSTAWVLLRATRELIDVLNLVWVRPDRGVR